MDMSPAPFNGRVSWRLLRLTPSSTQQIADAAED
jgi:hypothetical protein